MDEKNAVFRCANLGGDGTVEQLAANTSQLNDDWAQPLEKLWIWRFADFEAEREFNRTMALEEPHCAVCQYFVPRSLCKKVDRIPQWSVLVFLVT